MILQNFSKIITTIGPSSNNEEVLKQFIECGIRIFRLNFSHGNYKVHAQTIHIIRSLEQLYNIPLTIIADLQGPKIRIGILTEPMAVKEKQIINIALESKQSQPNTLPLPYESVFHALQENNTLLIDDGKIKLKIIDTKTPLIQAKVYNNGIIQSHKSFTVPNIHLDVPVITPKDDNDLQFAIKHQCDWIAMSFVQTADDIILLREKIHKLSTDAERASIIAKLERPIAVTKNLHAILKESDAIMVARGDMGVELPLENIPLYQKDIIKACTHIGKPVIVATQMLESMLTSSVPSRADITDIANAILDGTSCVMLSGESAVSKNPVHIVKTMTRIIKTTEQSSIYKASIKELAPYTIKSDDAIAYACKKIVKHFPIEVIISLTTTGNTTKRIVHYRPSVSVVSVSPRWKTARKLNLFYGCFPIKIDPQIFHSIQHLEEYGHFILAQLNKKFPKNSSAILTAGYPFGISGSTNILRIFKIHNDNE